MSGTKSILSTWHATKQHGILTSAPWCFAENERREQRRVMDAVRGILTSSVQSELGSQQQAFLQDQSSWQPPAPPAGTYHASMQLCTSHQQLSSKHQRIITHVPLSTLHTCTVFAKQTAMMTTTWRCSHGLSALAGSSTRQNIASGAASAQTAEPAGSSVAAGAASAAHSSPNAPAPDATQQPARRQQQQASSDSQTASGNRQDAAAGSGGRNADGRRQRRTRRPAISPVVTMALGSLLQSTLQGDAYRDPAGVLTNAAQLLLNSHSFEGDNRQQVLVG